MVSLRLACCAPIHAPPRYPLLALTAFAMKEDSDRFLGAGFDGYLGKPIDIKDIPIAGACLC